MVDEAAFRHTVGSVISRPCPFGRAILARTCACAKSEKHAIAEREAAACTDAAAQTQCVLLHGLLLHNATFALRHLLDDTPLTHAQEMKLQCGGLLGLQRALDGASEVTDVAMLVAAARQRFGSLDALPYAQIMQGVASFDPRKRSAAS